jgi:hypothetical protein
VVAAWRAVSLAGSYQLLAWLIRACEPTARGPPEGHPGNGAAARPVPACAADGERPGASQGGTSGPAWRPAGQAAGQPAIPAGAQAADDALEASAVNHAAVATYRLSVQAGHPLSERRLAQMSGRASRRWARARIADARQASPLPDSPSPAQQASWQPTRRRGKRQQTAQPFRTSLTARFSEISVDEAETTGQAGRKAGDGGFSGAESKGL